MENIIKSRGRKKGNIHEYFVLNNDKRYCNINGCEKNFSSNTSMSILKSHVEKNHEQITIKNIDNTDIMNKNIDKNDFDVYKAFAIAFSVNSLPHSLIEDTNFKNALDAYTEDKTKILTKAKLREKIIDVGNEINNNILNKLSANKQPITIAIDGWTNVRSNKVTNLLIISNGKAYYYTSIENIFNQNTAEWLTTQIEIKINELLQKGINIVAITTDNENTMKAVCKELKNIFPVLIDIPCSAHLIQLCMKHICCLPEINKIIEKITDLVDLIKNNKEHSTKLNKLQNIDGSSKILKIIRPTPIRWSSIILCIERLLKLKNFINVVIDNLDVNFWKNIEDLFILLEPFKIYTDQIQKDNASLYTVSSSIQQLELHLSSDKIPKIFEKIIKEIISTFKNKWNNHANETIINVSKLFNFDKTYKINKSVINFIEEWGYNYLTFYNITAEKDKKKIKNLINLQLKEFNARQSEFESIDNEVDNLKRICTESNKTYNPILIWGCYQSTHFELSRVAVAILSICPSESCVERSFSAQSDIHSLDRNRLTNKIIEAEMKIKININK